MNDSSSSDWGSDIPVAPELNKPLITLEKITNSLEFDENLLIKEYKDDIQLKTTNFTIFSQININFNKVKNSKWVTESDILNSINKLPKFEDIFGPRDLDVDFLSDMLKFVMKHNGSVDLQEFYLFLRLFRLEEQEELDECLILQIIKYLAKFIDSESIEEYKEFFQNYCFDHLQSKMLRYAKVVYSIALLNNIDLIDNSEVKSSLRVMRDALLSIDEIASFFDCYLFGSNTIYIYKNEKRDWIDVQTIAEVVQAIETIYNYYSTVSLVNLNDDYLLKYTHRYFKLKKTEQESEIASNSLECDRDCFLTSDGDKNKIIDVIGSEFTCSILLLSLWCFNFDPRYIVNYLQGYAFSSEFIQDYLNSQENDKFITKEPIQQIIITQNLELIGDIIASDNYNISNLYLIVENVPGNNLIKGKIIEEFILEKQCILVDQEIEELIYQFYYLVKEIGDFDTILSFLLELFREEEKHYIARLIAQSFDQIFYFQMAQAFYCIASNSYKQLLVDEVFDFNILEEYQQKEYPKLFEELVLLKNIKIVSRERNLVMNNNIFEIQYSRVLNYEQEGNINNSMDLIGELLEQELDIYERNKILSKLIELYSVYGSSDSSELMLEINLYETLILEFLKEKFNKIAINSIICLLDLYMSQGEFVEVFTITILLSRCPFVLQKQKLEVLLYEIRALASMNGYRIEFSDAEPWNMCFDFSEPVRETIKSGGKLILYLIETSKSVLLLQPYSLFLYYHMKENNIKFFVGSRQNILGLLLYNINEMLSRSSYEIKFEENIDLHILLLNISLDIERDEGSLHKLIPMKSIEYNDEDAFTLENEDSFIIETQKLKQEIVRLSQIEEYSFVENILILLIYLKYWIMNDYNNQSIISVLAHCEEVICKTIIFNSTALFGTFANKKYYLYESHYIMEEYLLLLLISSSPITKQDYQIMNAFLILEYEIKNSKTRVIWPAVDSKTMQTYNKQRLLSHSFNPYLIEIESDKELYSMYCTLLLEIESLLNSLSFSEDKYHYSTKVFVKKQKNLEINDDHIEFTVFEENYEKTQIITNKLYKLQVNQYFELNEKLRNDFEITKLLDLAPNQIVILELEKYVFEVQGNEVTNIIELTYNGEDNMPSKQSCSYYNEIALRKTFSTRNVISNKKLAPLTRSLNEAALFELDPDIMIENDYEVPLNQTENQTVIEYLQEKFKGCQNSNLFISLNLEFLPFERLFSNVKRYASFVEYEYLQEEKVDFYNKLLKYTNYISEVNKSEGCRFSEKKVNRIINTSINIYGAKAKIPPETEKLIEEHYKVYYPEISLSSNKEPHEFTKRQSQFEALFAWLFNPVIRSNYSSSLPLSNELIDKNQELQHDCTKSKMVKIQIEKIYEYIGPVETESEKIKRITPLLEADDTFTEWLASTKFNSIISLDVQKFGKEEFDINFFELADYYTMNDSIIQQLSCYSDKISIFLSGRDYIEILPKISILPISYDYYELKEQLREILEEHCNETFIMLE